MTEPISGLARSEGGRIVLVVIDGLGGFRSSAHGSELKEAWTPNLDALAAEGSSGVLEIVGPGITPGSGAGHLALFGYDPFEHLVGRGTLSAAGIGFDLEAGDVAARVNFCTLDASGAVADRRAGRIATEANRRLCAMLREGLDTGGRAEVFVETERDHRALLVLRGEGLSPKVADTDPQVTGVPPRDPAPAAPEAGETAALLSALLAQARKILAGEQANFLLLRGFDTRPDIPSMKDRYRLDAFGVACYPMYAGLARLLGMEVPPLQESLAAEVAAAAAAWDRCDFFYLHHKAADSAGEDGDFDAKVSAIEAVDAVIPDLRALDPAVICVTGDHATPSQVRSHSWHPVPMVMWGEGVGIDGASSFDEEQALHGLFGKMQAKDLMACLLGAAGRLDRYGA